MVPLTWMTLTCGFDASAVAGHDAAIADECDKKTQILCVWTNLWDFNV